MDIYQAIMMVGLLLVSSLGAILWYIVTSTICDLKNLSDQLMEHKIEVANNYAKIADVRSSYEKVFGVLSELKDTINKIAISVSVLETKVENKQLHQV